MEIFKDNKPLLEQLNEDILTCFVQLCTHPKKQAQYLNFLCELCVCEGAAIIKNQDIICQRLMANFDNIVLPMKLDEERQQVLTMLPQHFLFQESKHPTFESLWQVPSPPAAAARWGGHRSRCRGVARLSWFQQPLQRAPRGSDQGGRGEVRNSSQFFAISQFSRNSLVPVPGACLLVPCVSPVQRWCSLRLQEVWLRHRNFPTIFPRFPAIFRNWI